MPRKATQSRNPDIFRFIDFFVKTGEKILGTKPAVIRGKDGRLASLALRTLSVSKLETLTVWFFVHKKNLRPLIGTMLSHAVLEELEREMNTPSFWKEVDRLMDRYYPRHTSAKLWQPFTHADITHIKEAVARDARKHT